MINDVFYELKYDIGKSLFADDVALLKYGKNLMLIQKKMQEAIWMIEKWSYSRGYKFQ